MVMVDKSAGANTKGGLIEDKKHSYRAVRLSEISMELEMIKCVDLREGAFEIDLVINLEEDFTNVDGFDASTTANENKRSVQPITISELTLFRRIYKLRQKLDLEQSLAITRQPVRFLSVV